MRSQCAIYVDAGYLLAASATRVTGTSLRSAAEVDHAALIGALIDQAVADSGLPLLRVNWYDSGSRPNGLPDFAQEQIGMMSRVKLRLGRRSWTGEQKGVDLRIGLDLATHGRQRVVDVIYLVSGDDDLTEAVEEAQSHGIQVTLLVVPEHSGRPHAVARHLQRAADGVLLIDADRIDAAVRSRKIPEELKPAETPEHGADSVAGEGHESHAPESSAAGPGEVDPLGMPPTPLRAAGDASDGADAGHVAAVTDVTHADGVTDAGADSEAPQPLSSPAASPDPRGGGGHDEATKPDTSGHDRPITPSIFKGKRSQTLLPPPPGPAIAWSSSAGVTLGEGGDTSVTLADIDLVARGVVEVWCRTATPEGLSQIKAGKPSIPNDLDRALLMDLSNRSDVYDIPEWARHTLRDRFWQLLERVRLG